MARSSSPGTGCSTDSEPLRRSTQRRERLMHSNGLGDAQAVAIDHQEQDVVANTVAAFLGGLKQLFHLRTAQKVLAAFVGIRRGAYHSLHYAPWSPPK